MQWDQKDKLNLTYMMSGKISANLKPGTTLKGI
jgi:hypothetical protein